MIRTMHCDPWFFALVGENRMNHRMICQLLDMVQDYRKIQLLFWLYDDMVLSITLMTPQHVILMLNHIHLSRKTVYSDYLPLAPYLLKAVSDDRDLLYECAHDRYYVKYQIDVMEIVIEALNFIPQEIIDLIYEYQIVGFYRHRTGKSIL